jgi:hypothetical protein
MHSNSLTAVLQIPNVRSITVQMFPEFQVLLISIVRRKRFGSNCLGSVFLTNPDCGALVVGTEFISKIH